MNPANPSATPSTLDPEAIARLRSLAQDTDPALFSDILVMFSGDLMRYHHDIRSAVMGQDAEALRRAAHALKGASLSTGANSLAEISTAMESAADTGSLSLVPALLRSLESEIPRVQADIQLELSVAA